MDLNKILAKELLCFRDEIIAKANRGAETEKKWAAQWKEGCIKPPPENLFFPSDLDGNLSFADRLKRVVDARPSFFTELVLYNSILASCDEKEYDSAFEKAFQWKFRIGFQAGLKKAREEELLRRANGKHEHKRNAALSYYKRFSMDKLKYAVDAADKIYSDAKVGLEHDTIYIYIKYYRKRVKRINSATQELQKTIGEILGSGGQVPTDVNETLKEKIEDIRLKEINDLRFVSPRATGG